MRKLNEYNRPAVKVAFYFLIFGFFWILLSDKVLNYLVSDYNVREQMQTFKGWFFIVITALVIYFIVRTQIKMVVKLKNQLNESDYLYKQIVGLTHDVIWTLDKNGVITFINQASKRVYGFYPEEMIGKKINSFTNQDSNEKNKKLYFDYLKQGITSIKLETQFTNPVGKTIYLQDNVHTLLDEHGNVSKIIGSSKDITSIKLSEKKLIETNQRLEIALLGDNLGLWDYDLQTRKILVNNTWEKITGIVEPEKIIDFIKYTNNIYPDDTSKVMASFEEMLQNNIETFDVEHRFLYQNKDWIWLHLIGIVAKRNENNQPCRIIGTIQNITTKKQLELDLNYWLEVHRSFIKYANEGIFLYELEKPVVPTMPVEEQIDIIFNHGYIKTCNDSFANMYGYEHSSEMEGFTLSRLQGGDNFFYNKNFLKKLINSNYRVSNEISIDKDRSGNPLYISNNIVGIIVNGELVRIWGSQFNNTDQILAQKELEKSELRYRLLFKTNPVPLIIFSLDDFKLIDANNSAEKLFGYTHHELLNTDIKELRPEIADYTNKELLQKVKAELSKITEMTLVKKTKMKMITEVTTEIIDVQDKNYVIAAINDITLLRETEKMVISSLIEGEDRERTRVAKEIHDSLGQNLTAASLNFNAVKHLVENLNDKEKEKYNLGFSFLNMAIEESRNIALNLMPKAIEDYGLILSLKSLFNKVEMSGDIKITFFENFKTDYRLPRNIELNLYRITQEVLNNVLKHAKANTIFIQLLLHKNEIIYTFEDDGKGFNIKSPTKEFKGMGLVSISNRVKALSGSLEIDSTPKKGTAITIQIPL
jgi:PAS domain S-box-containing protein